MRLVGTTRRIDLFTYKLLQEYKAPELKWIDTIFKEYHQKKIKVFDIFGDLTKEAKNFINWFYNHGVIVKFIKVKRKNSNVNGLGTDSINFMGWHKKNQQIEIWLWSNAFENFKPGNEEFQDMLRLSVKETVAHENYHEQQKAGQQYRDYINPETDNMMDEENDSYYNQKTEIAAYAAEIGQKLKDYGITQKDLIKELFKNKFEDLIDLIEINGNYQRDSSLKRYYNNRNKYPTEWKNFLKIMWNYLEK